jgi:hypothetical protein
MPDALHSVNAADAAKLAETHERTIRRQIASGKLPATKQPDGQWLIRVADLKRLYPDLALPDPFTHGEPNHPAMRELLDAINRLLAAGQWPPSAPLPARVPVQTRPLVARPTHDTLPPGSVLARHFALAHDVSPPTVQSQITAGAYPHIAIPHGAKQERWLTPQHQHSALLYWQANGAHYRPCPACPHDSD